MPLICWKRWTNWFCGVWTVERLWLKVQCFPWPSSVLIFHLTHTTSTPASAPQTVPVSTAHLSNLPLSSTCVTPALGHGMISLQKSTRSVAILSCFTPPLKTNPLHDPGQCRMLAKLLVGWGDCCHPLGFYTSSVLTNAHFWASALLCGAW